MALRNTSRATDVAVEPVIEDKNFRLVSVELSRIWVFWCCGVGTWNRLPGGERLRGMRKLIAILLYAFMSPIAIVRSTSSRPCDRQARHESEDLRRGARGNDRRFDDGSTSSWAVIAQVSRRSLIRRHALGGMGHVHPKRAHTSGHGPAHEPCSDAKASELIASPSVEDGVGLPGAGDARVLAHV